MAKPSVLWADDHTLVAEAFQAIVAGEFETVGVVSEGRAMIELARQLRPDTIVADIGMPGLNGLDAGRIILSEMPQAKIVFVTMNEDPDLAAAAFRIGASGYLLKNSAGEELMRCLWEVMAGRRYLTNLIAGGAIGPLLQSGGCSNSPQLSIREREILQLLAEGKSMKEIAWMLSISVRTVQFHKYNIVSRCQFKNSADLIQLAITLHLVDK